MSIGVILSVFLGLSLVVFFHEFGHFLVCKLVGIKVLRFAFGFGPEIVGVTRGDTRYSICAFPLGGFVKPAGEDPEEATGAADEFFAASWKARIGVALAGPAMNYILSFLIFWAAFSFFGLPDFSREPVAGVILQGSPAEAAGIRPNDRVTRITTADGSLHELNTWQDMAQLIHSHPEETLKLSLQREGSLIEVSVTSKKDPQRGVGLIGIAPASVYTKVNPWRACVLSAQQLWRWSSSTVVYLWEKTHRGEKPEIAGPIGIIRVMSKAARSGWEDFLSLIAVISVAIGLFNLFPIPLLDGGHIVLYLWEGLSRRKLTRKFLTRANTVGIAVLVPIFVLAFYNDIESIVKARAAKAKTEFQEILK